MIQLAVIDFITIFIATVAGMITLHTTEKSEIFRIGPEQSQIIVRNESEAEITGRPEIIHICKTASDVVVLTIRAQSVKHGVQVPYKSQPGDEVIVWRQHRYIRRSGNRIGALVRSHDRIIQLPDRLVGDALDTKVTDQVNTCRIRSEAEDSDIYLRAVF
jgi:hypothetical protein